MGSAKYFGFFLGPTASEHQWSDSARKFQSRAKSIGGVHAPASISAVLYNRDAVAVLMYKAQLCALPLDIKKIETTAIQTVLHVATNALTINAFLNLPHVGVP